MSVLDVARIIIYRFHEKGLEVFLINPDLDEDPEVWKTPQALKNEVQLAYANGASGVIALDPVKSPGGELTNFLAIEGDWHDIPSIRGIIKHDVKRVKNKIKEVVPGIEKGSFVAVKEAFKKVMPDEYNALKELKDILVDRNTITNI